jgi:hypothetical protein
VCYHTLVEYGSSLHPTAAGVGPITNAIATAHTLAPRMLATVRPLTHHLLLPPAAPSKDTAAL